MTPQSAELYVPEAMTAFMRSTLKHDLDLVDYRLIILTELPHVLWDRDEDDDVCALLLLATHFH